MVRQFLIVAGLTLLAGGLAFLGVEALNRWWPRRREPSDPEPPSLRAAATRARDALRLRLVRTPPATPHVGATEHFGVELRALRSAEVSPELVSDVETEARWAGIWHDFEQGLHAQVDAIFAPALSQLTGPLDAETCIRLEAAAWPTGEFPVAELEALLAADSRGLVPA